MGDGSGDLQRVWHECVGKMFSGKTILDVGAGLGLSKTRLANSGSNIVTTHDIERSRIEAVDLICPIDKIWDKYDVVTAFDVIEHTADPEEFCYQLGCLAKQFVFMSTPNWYAHPRAWHFSAVDFVKMIQKQIGHFDLAYFARYKTESADEITPVTEEVFMCGNASIYALGIRVRVG